MWRVAGSRRETACVVVEAPAMSPCFMWAALNAASERRQAPADVGRLAGTSRNAFSARARRRERITAEERTPRRRVTRRSRCWGALRRTHDFAIRRAASRDTGCGAAERRLTAGQDSDPRERVSAKPESREPVLQVNGGKSVCHSRGRRTRLRCCGCAFTFLASGLAIRSRPDCSAALCWRAPTRRGLRAGLLRLPGGATARGR